MRTAARYLALVLVVMAWFACDRPTPVAPASSTLTISANPTRIDVTGEATITILARKADGTAVNPGTEINFATTLGTIDPVAFTDDRGVAEAILRGDNRIGMATVTVDSGAATTVTIEIQIGALASFLDFEANPTSISKDTPPGGKRIRLKATVRDDLNNVIPNTAVAFEADIGTLEFGSLETNNKGVARDTLTVKSVAGVTDGFFEVRAQTAADAGDQIIEIIEITVTGFAASIRLTATPTSIPATGGVVQLSALVRDDETFAAVGENVNFITDLGTLASGGGLVPTDDGGQAFDTLTITEADLASLPVGTGITVSAEVGASGGILIESEPVTIALQTEEPIAGFDFTVTGLTVNFTNTTTGDAPLTYEWDFGDGGTSTSENPGNTYPAEGTYSVSLTATNLGGSDTITKDVVVEATPNIDVSPTGTVSFGSTSASMGPAVERDIFISNTGVVDLDVSGLSVTGTVFTLISPPSLPFAVAPGGTEQIRVRFSPTVGPVAPATSVSSTEVLSIISDDPDSPVVERTLSGSATS